MSLEKNLRLEIRNTPRFKADQLNPHDIRTAMHRYGCFVVENALPTDFIKRAIPQLETAIDKEAQWHRSSQYQDYGMVLICSLYGGIFWELFDNPAVTLPFEAVLGEGCIVYAYTSSSMPPFKENYSTRIHVDCPRVIPNYVTNMGATILLNDFTEENGATYFLPGSHEQLEAPAPNEFLSQAERLVAKAGSILFFNARIWHMGGKNMTAHWRHALTINMCRSFMRQRIDLPRAMEGMDLSSLSSKARQKLGFDVQIPSSMEEYYQPPEKRKFKQRTE